MSSLNFAGAIYLQSYISRNCWLCKICISGLSDYKVRITNLYFMFLQQDTRYLKAPKNTRAYYSFDFSVEEYASQPWSYCILWQEGLVNKSLQRVLGEYLIDIKVPI